MCTFYQHFLSKHSQLCIQVTPQSPEFIPSRVNSSPNFYSPYSVISGGLTTPLKQNNITPILGGNNYSTTPNKGLTNRNIRSLIVPFRAKRKSLNICRKKSSTRRFTSQQWRFSETNSTVITSAADWWCGYWNTSGKRCID